MTRKSFKPSVVFFSLASLLALNAYASTYGKIENPDYCEYILAPLKISDLVVTKNKVKVAEILLKDGGSVSGYVLSAGDKYAMIDTAVTMDLDKKAGEARYKAPKQTSIKPGDTLPDRIRIIELSDIAPLPNPVQEVSEARYWRENVSSKFSIEDFFFAGRMVDDPKLALDQRALAQHFIEDRSKVGRFILKDSANVVTGQVVGSFMDAHHQTFLEVDTRVQLEFIMNGAAGPKARFKDPLDTSTKAREGKFGGVEVIAVNDLAPMKAEDVELTPSQFWQENYPKEFTLEDYLSLQKMADNAQVERQKIIVKEYRELVADTLNLFSLARDKKRKDRLKARPIQFQLMGSDAVIYAHVLEVSPRSKNGFVRIQKIQGTPDDLSFAKEEGSIDVTFRAPNTQKSEDIDLTRIRIDSIKALFVSQVFPPEFSYADFLHYGRMYKSKEDAEKIVRAQVEATLLTAYNEDLPVRAYVQIFPPLAVDGAVGHRIARLDLQQERALQAGTGLSPELPNDKIQIEIGSFTQDSALYQNDIVKVEIISSPIKTDVKRFGVSKILLEPITYSDKELPPEEDPRNTLVPDGESTDAEAIEEEDMPAAHDTIPDMKAATDNDVLLTPATAHSFKLNEDFAPYKNFRKSLSPRPRLDNLSELGPISNWGHNSLVRYKDAQQKDRLAIIADYGLDDANNLRRVSLLNIDDPDDAAATAKRADGAEPFIFKELSKGDPETGSDFLFFAASFKTAKEETYMKVRSTPIIKDLLISGQDGLAWEMSLTTPEPGAQAEPAAKAADAETDFSF